MKVILLTMCSTVIVMFLVAGLFLNTILGAFGLVSTSINTLSNLKTSKSIVQKMKRRDDIKKLNITKKLAKRSSRRVASVSLAAATIGTVAVAVTMTGFEAYDYCEDKEVLHDDHNVLYGSTDEFSSEKCLEEAKDESRRILTEVKESASVSVTNAMNSTVRYSSEKWLALKASVDKSFDSVSASTRELWEPTKIWGVK